MVEGFYPTTIKEALEIKNTHPDAMMISGGTDAMVVKKPAQKIVFMNNIAETQEVEDLGDTISIGAGMCYTDLIRNELVPEILKKAMRKIASPAIRSAGTLAGNVCNASPAGDSLPVLYSLDAVIVTSSLKDDMIVERRTPIKDFILGIRKIDLRENEVVTSIEIPKAPYENITKVYYEKVGARQSEAISKLSFVGLVKVEEDKIKDIRFAFGSVGITVMRFKQIEAKLVGLTLEEFDEVRENIAHEVMSYIHPIDDQRSTAQYRITVCSNLLNDFFNSVGECKCTLLETVDYIQDHVKAS